MANETVREELEAFYDDCDKFSARRRLFRSSYLAAVKTAKRSKSKTPYSQAWALQFGAHFDEVEQHWITEIFDPGNRVAIVELILGKLIPLKIRSEVLEKEIKGLNVYRDRKQILDARIYYTRAGENDSVPASALLNTERKMKKANFDPLHFSLETPQQAVLRQLEEGAYLFGDIGGLVGGAVFYANVSSGVDFDKSVRRGAVAASIVDMASMFTPKVARTKGKATKVVAGAPLFELAPVKQSRKTKRYFSPIVPGGRQTTRKRAATRLAQVLTGVKGKMSVDYAVKVAEETIKASPWLPKLKRIKRLAGEKKRFRELNEFIEKFNEAGAGVTIDVVPKERAGTHGIGYPNWGTYNERDKKIYMHEGAWTDKRADAVREVAHEVGAWEVTRQLKISKKQIPAVMGEAWPYVTHVVDALID